MFKNPSSKKIFRFSCVPLNAQGISSHEVAQHPKLENSGSNNTEEDQMGIHRLRFNSYHDMPLDPYASKMNSLFFGEIEMLLQSNKYLFSGAATNPNQRKYAISIDPESSPDLGHLFYDD